MLLPLGWQRRKQLKQFALLADHNTGLKALSLPTSSLGGHGYGELDISVLRAERALERESSLSLFGSVLVRDR
jgi:hypothetical protein